MSLKFEFLVLFSEETPGLIRGRNKGATENNSTAADHTTLKSSKDANFYWPPGVSGNVKLIMLTTTTPEVSHYTRWEAGQCLTTWSPQLWPGLPTRISSGRFPNGTWHSEIMLQGDIYITIKEKRYRSRSIHTRKVHQCFFRSTMQQATGNSSGHKSFLMPQVRAQDMRWHAYIVYT